MTRGKKKFAVYGVAVATALALVTSVAAPFLGRASASPRLQEAAATLRQDYGRYAALRAETMRLAYAWDAGKLSRDELAVQALPLMQELKQLETAYAALPPKLGNADYDNAMLTYKSMQLKTEVMLFDMLRGYPVAGSSYAGQKQLPDATFHHVISLRDAAYQKDVGEFLAAEGRLP